MGFGFGFGARRATAGALYVECVIWGLGKMFHVGPPAWSQGLVPDDWKVVSLADRQRPDEAKRNRRPLPYHATHYLPVIHVHMYDTHMKSMHTFASGIRLYGGMVES